MGKRECDALVMAMNAVRPMETMERNLDLIWGSLMVTLLIGVPLTGGAFLVGRGDLPLAVGVSILSIGLFFLLGFARRTRVLRGFYRFEEADEAVEVIDSIGEESTLMRGKPALVMCLPADPCVLVVIRNWFVHRNLVEPEDRIVLHRVRADWFLDSEDEDAVPGSEALFFSLERFEPDEPDR
ncbi:MAG: hypothetical protein IJH87_04680, partial [Atopobiaceae bacterium]|nr:hypothetical protein [Atopobiaceae bacterium]